MSDSWKLTLPCTKAEAEAVATTEIDGVVLVVTEEDEAAARWRLDAYFEGEPEPATLAAVRAVVADGGDAAPSPLPARDWVAQSQAGLAPLHIGRFHVFTAANLPAGFDAAAGHRAFLIDAGRAFGTGHHETTAGCLAMLDAMADERFGNVIDLGTGTGLLGFAARHLWPAAEITLTDVDPIAIEVTRENAAVNGLAAPLRLVVADGARDGAVVERAPYDLIIANILAGPLIAMAGEVAAIAAPGATLILAGLLETQRDDVAAAYAACGCMLEAAERHGDWSVLRLTAAAERHVAVAAPDRGGRDGWALDL